MHLKSETLILLTKDEEWIASFSVSQNSDSTITVCSGNSYTGLSSPSSSDISLENRNVSHTDDSIDMPVSNMEYVWANFRVPWNKLPVDIFESAKAGDKSVHVKTQIVHSIIYEMRHIRKYIPAKAFKYVAKQVIEKFSETFQDIDNDGTIIGDGTHSLVCKLIDRNNYLNRPHKTGYFRKSTSPALTKRKRNCMAGCTEWESPIPEKDDIANEKAELQNCVENESYFSLLEKTYAKQREFLNNVEEPPSVYDIKREWPVIFKKSAIVWHFEKLTGTNIDKLKTSLQEKAPKIIEYGIQKKLLQLEKNLNPTYSCLQFYARSFREDISFLFYKAKVSFLSYTSF